MKKAVAILVLGAMLAMSGCNSDKKKDESQTTTTAVSDADSTTKETKVTEMAITMGTTEIVSPEALDFISKAAPLYRKYIEKRMSIPLIMECKITNNEGTVLRSLYIKEDESVSTYAKNKDGSESDTIYSLNGCYFLDHTEKKAYQFKYTDERAKEYMDAYKYSIAMKDVVTISETGNGEAEYNGTSYKYEKLIDADGETTYYFDKNTDDLKFIVSGDTTTEILKIEAAEPDNSHFTVPDGYEVIDFFEYASTMTTAPEPTPAASE